MIDIVDIDIDVDVLKLHTEETALRMLKSESIDNDNLVSRVKQESGAGLSPLPQTLTYALNHSSSC